MKGGMFASLGSGEVARFFKKNQYENIFHGSQCPSSQRSQSGKLQCRSEMSDWEQEKTLNGKNIL
jgi:hypothetical protein